MKRVWFHNIVLILSVGIVALVSAGCEEVFPVDKLDCFWRLKQVVYADGNKEEPKSVFYGFARHLVQVENHSVGSSYWGSTLFTGDSLRLDFSAYARPDNLVRYNLDSVSAGLKTCGIDSLVKCYGVEGLTGSTMILSAGGVVLYFEKW